MAAAEADRREETAALLRALVEIPSVNPRGRAPNRAAGEGEAKVAGFVRDWLGERWVTATIAEVLPGRPNVLAVLPGRDRRAVLLESHPDTVEASDVGTGPLAGQIRDGRLYGRGVCDAKGPLAAFMLATAALAARPPACTVVLAAVCDEEHGYRGRRERDEFIGLAGVPGSIEVDEPFTVDYALDTPASSDIVTALVQALRDHGRPAAAIGLPFGTDASRLARAGRHLDTANATMARDLLPESIV